VSVPGRLHGAYVHPRRVERLAAHLAALVPASASVLDVGCGDGLLAHRLGELRPDLSLSGIDTLVRPATRVPVARFDGRRLPNPDASVDVVMFVDVLHHADDPLGLLREACRVARRALVIKDHTREGLLAGPTLRFMDFVGNARHGVALPYNYWTHARWLEAFAGLGLEVRSWVADLRLYPRAADWLFGRGLHFVARLEPAGRAAGASA
jgi:SAM-dependent methyltransferase